MVILCHIGETIPSHLYECIKQTRKYFKGKIILITNSLEKNLLSKYEVEFCEIDFDNKKYDISKNVNFNSNPNREFWLYSLCRLFFIEDYVVKNKINNFVTYDNDVLIYSDLSYILKKLSKIYENIGITIVDEVRVTTGFAFFKSYKDLVNLNDDIIEIIKSPVMMEDLIRDYCGGYPSEMTFIRKISKDKNYIKPLPTFPTDGMYEKLGFVFDPAGYGMFLGGLPEVHGGSEDSYIDETTYIGNKLINKEYKVLFNSNEGPILVDNNNTKVKIYNLHVWSKKLKKFM
jgi:hypothetical protein